MCAPAKRAQRCQISAEHFGVLPGPAPPRHPRAAARGAAAAAATGAKYALAGTEGTRTQTVCRRRTGSVCRAGGRVRLRRWRVFWRGRRRLRRQWMPQRMMGYVRSVASWTVGRDGFCATLLHKLRIAKCLFLSRIPHNVWGLTFCVRGLHAWDLASR